MTEYRKIVEEHNDFIVESLHKIVPGYTESRWNGAYDAENNIQNALMMIRGGVIFSGCFAAGLNTRVNEEYELANKH